MKKENRISYKAGITRSPSDFLCEDGELAECINLVTDNEELKTVVDPAEKITGTDVTILYVHKFNDQERYIGYRESNVYGTTTYPMVYGTKSGNTLQINGTLGIKGSVRGLEYHEGTILSTIGKTLIVAGSQGMFYYLWTYESGTPKYEPLGDSFPRPVVDFRLDDREGKDFKEETNAMNEIGVEHNIMQIGIDQQENWNNIVVGLYSKLKKRISQDKRFHGSFCVRAALELYDGSYYHISNPVFMLNQFSSYGVAFIDGTGGFGSSHIVTMHAKGSKLSYRFDQDYSGWSDIIKNVVLFVTREAYILDTAVDAILKPGSDGVAAQTPIAYFMSGNRIYADSTHLDTASTSEGDLYRVLESIPDSDLEETIKAGVYYKLCEIGLAGDGNWHDAGDHFDTHTLENLTTLTQLGEDDYYSHAPIRAGYMYSYNSRLNLANVSRGFFEGFDNFMPFDTPLSGQANDETDYTIIVTIRTDGGDVQVIHHVRTTQIYGYYFYYPDARARHVKIWYDDTSLILDEDLTEHPRLNGAYYFAGISPQMDFPTETYEEIPAVETHFETLPNYIITSEVNNPFVFKAEGYFKVGTGKILGMSSVTQALSEGQFGEYPLLVFSTEGIWALSVGSNGLYTSIHPISREVSKEPSYIVQTDGAVFFVSKKGLMVIVGSQVKCVSEQMNGIPFDTADLPSPASPWESVITPCQGSSTFLEFIRDSRLRIAYDYTDSRLLLINPAYGFAYAYGMADGSISKVILPGSVTNVVSDYPDYLLQAGDKVYTLYGKPREDEITARKTAFLLTRPMKLAGPLTVTSLRELVNVGMWDMDGGSMVKTVVWVSDDLHRWYVRSSRFGAAARYYRIGLFIKMKPTERLSGTIVMQQERRTDNKRA